ncbi:sigma-54-dependent Fis family transcriptional regulator [Bremerella cremea]|uniref:DNA-binding transcriptional regulator NtrC n=1 Tax=Blastopirellula marina TaxID=124 RepID=A0A2S8FDR5_9BACT|nr:MULTISPECIES: sigma-54 dependent transcriptional regulator [Pirellulaceae]PQO30321.1 Fis family transcriptional regulator [Blastopirellula marina]RCS43672.1 sigma-54-dependent Fis family transcriptional regulator [Bremerella cremea]
MTTQNYLGAKRERRVLVIDDDPSVATVVTSALSQDEVRIQHAETGANGLQQLVQFRPDVLILDHLLPDGEGLQILGRVNRIDARLPVLFVTARNSSELAIEAMKQGAFDFLSKPLQLEKIQEKTQQALESRRLMLMPVQLPSQVDPMIDGADHLIGQCPEMQEVYKAIGRAAAHDVPVLIEGEIGTGKELVARAIYQHGRRKDRPFVKVVCSDFGPEWLESELFGHEPNSFPGATERRIGKIEQCHGGTVLLEDISAIPQPLQSKLVRFIQDKTFERIGGQEAIQVNTTLLFTSSKNAERLTTEGVIRHDLFYSLNSFMIRIPPLRERGADLTKLVDHFVGQFCRVERIGQTGAVRTSPDALRLLTDYPWPGNVAELRSVLRRALVESRGTVIAGDYLRTALRDLPRNDVGLETKMLSTHVCDWEDFIQDKIDAGSNDLYSDAVMEMERHVLTIILRKTSGNQAKAARMLGITRTSLRKKIHYLGLAIEEFVSTV